MEELQRLLKDKTQTIDSLRRQLDRSNREGVEDSLGKKRSTAFEMPNFRENKGEAFRIIAFCMVSLSFSLRLQAMYLK